MEVFGDFRLTEYDVNADDFGAIIGDGRHQLRLFVPRPRPTSQLADAGHVNQDQSNILARRPWAAQQKTDIERGIFESG